MTSGYSVCLFSFLLAIQLTSCNFSIEGIVELSAEKRLIKSLLFAYEQRGVMGRPVEDQNDTLVIYYGLSLIQILDLDERNQVLSTNVWASYKWTDIYLRWEPSLYGNITTIRVPKETIWLPDIKLYNYADVRLEEKRDALMVISYDGTVDWIPQAIFKSSCYIDIKHFPFDSQKCHMKFGSWTYDGSKLDLVFLYSLDTGFELGEYIESNEWDILNSSAEKNVHYYACCPEPYIDLTFRLTIRRQPAFYNYILILPCILLSSLTLVLFWLPPESPAKMQLGMNIFVAFFVLLLLLAESTPPAAASIPLIGAYYCLNMVMITLSTFLSVVVVNLYFHGSRSEVPRLLKKIVVGVFARLMCMSGQLMGTKDVVHTRELGVVTTRNKRNTDFKYDKVGYFEMQTEESWKGLPNGTSSISVETETIQDYSTPLVNLEQEVTDIKTYLKAMEDRNSQRELKERISKEWRLIALVFDRLFFIVYLIAIIVSIFTLFENTLFSES